MDYTAFRQNMQDVFAEELGAKMVPGILEGPNEWSTEKWLGSVAISRIIEDPRNVAQVQIYLLVRVFAPHRSEGQISPYRPFDPTPLEEMASKIQAVIKRNQTGLGSWYQRVTGLEFDHTDQGVQATVFAYSDNDGISLA